MLRPSCLAYAVKYSMFQKGKGIQSEEVLGSSSNMTVYYIIIKVFKLSKKKNGLLQVRFRQCARNEEMNNQATISSHENITLDHQRGEDA